MSQSNGTVYYQPACSASKTSGSTHSRLSDHSIGKKNKEFLIMWWERNVSIKRPALDSYSVANFSFVLWYKSYVEKELPYVHEIWR